MRVCIVDCYSDEPAGLGVPPYLGTAPRYVFGAVLLAGSEPLYVNIDDARASWDERHDAINLTRRPEETRAILQGADLVVVLGGVHTPGKYLRANPGVPREIRRIVAQSRAPVFVGGPIAEGTMGGGKSLRSDQEALGAPAGIIGGDPEAFIHELLSEGGQPDTAVHRSYEELDRYASAGAALLAQTGAGPDLVCEVETSRGCARAVVGGCSFCSECSRFGLPQFRDAGGIVSEIRNLRMYGARNVRLGRQSCFFSYRASGIGDLEVPIPNPSAIESLLSACSKMGLDSLHIDNVNPAVVAKHPIESELVAKSIACHCTPGNVAALGVESADPEVVRKNNLKAYPEDALSAVELICRHGSGVGWNGQPMFLPGVNFVLGLPGETGETYARNFEFLRSILDRRLSLRRTNIRKVIPIRGTPLWGARWPQKAMRRNAKRFVARVRSEIDRPMLVRTYPSGTVLRGLVSELSKGNTTFCRFPGSYPVVVGMEERLKAKQIVDGIVVGHGYRSLTALRFPLDINSCHGSMLAAFPEIGPRRAARILLSRPIGSRTDLEKALEPDPPSHGALDLICRATGLG